jgi:transposase
MSRRRKNPLRSLTDAERGQLVRLSRSPSAPVAQATALLAIAAGESYTAAAHAVGRRHGEMVSAWVNRFNRDGLAAVTPRHGGGPPIRYSSVPRRCILAEVERRPWREQDGTATWSLRLLRQALRAAGDGLPAISTFPIWRTLHEAGLSWQKSRT